MYKFILLIMIPLIGTTLGSLFIYFLKHKLSERYSQFSSGLASGIMLAASIWSLLIPAINSSDFGVFKAVLGFGLGFVGFMYLSRLYRDKQNVNVVNIAVVIHNIPEGLTVGIVAAGVLFGNDLLFISALSLSLGIGIQNIPEGSIISLNSYHYMSKNKSFIQGFLSGIVEPIASILAVLLAKFVEGILPYLLGFAAGTMIFVVIDELLIEGHSKIGNLSFCFGFCLMLFLDVILG